MRVLIAPMSAIAETRGPFSRAVALCHKLIEMGHKVAFCSAEDVNYRNIENVKNYYAPIPSPFGTPMFIGKRLVKLAQLFGVQEKKKVTSFEQVLHFVGAIDKKHFYQDVFYIRKAIQDFKPDLVYAEFRLSAIIASKLENVKVITSYSYPVQKSFASNPEYSTGVKEFLQENNLPPIESVLDIFNWADLKVVPSPYGLEPIDKRFDFSKLMPEAIAYINHGGQNSIMTGLMYGIPQIICPGNGFERRYNAASIVNLGAGVSLEVNDFNSEIIKNTINDFNRTSIYINNSKKAGEHLLSLGGVTKVVRVMENLL